MNPSPKEARRLKKHNAFLLHEISIIHNNALIMGDRLGNILNEEHWRKERQKKSSVKVGQAMRKKKGE